MKTFTHQELVDFLRQTPEGKILDSLFATELGLQEYATHWAAFQDVLEYEGKRCNVIISDDDLETKVATFIIEMSNYVDFSGIPEMTSSEAQ